ncbi:MAG: GNAT family N-acetyltransferase [Halobacteria archaeon]|nr:GNAT family N-acetyltransferase [Halobacteria archaeon]
MQIDYLDYLPDEFRDSAIQLYLSALKDKLEPILGADGRAQEALGSNMVTDRCIVAIYDQKLVGILGMQTDKGSFLNPTLKTLVKSYGILGGIFRMGGLALLHHPTAPDELYVDGVAVVDELRGEGIGSKLFGMLERIALEKGIQKISLDVIDTNHRAKALYERLGFAETKQRTLWPFNLVFKFPFQSATQMVKTMG